MRLFGKLLGIASGVVGVIILYHGLPAYPDDTGPWWIAMILACVALGVSLICLHSLFASRREAKHRLRSLSRR